MKSKNIRFSRSRISRKMREKRNRHRSVVIWLTGLPCSGKSTLARYLEHILFEKGCQVTILDGDNVRHGINGDLGFSKRERTENIRRVGELAKLFAEAGFITIASFISPYRKDRLAVRRLFSRGRFIEVFVNANVDVCEKRDVKGLYRKARQGKIKSYTGVSAPYEVPLRPELTVPTGELTIKQSVDMILSFLKKRRVL